MGKPVIMVDNSNRKLSAAHTSYLGMFTDVHVADDFAAASELAQGLLTTMRLTAVTPPVVPPAPAAR